MTLNRRQILPAGLGLAATGALTSCAGLTGSNTGGQAPSGGSDVKATLTFVNWSGDTETGGTRRALRGGLLPVDHERDLLVPVIRIVNELALIATTLLSVPPLVVLFLDFQRFFLQGLATTGIR
jgi:hypothetical protein